MSPWADPARHSPPLRATQYLYASAAVPPITSPAAALLASISGCVPQYAHVGSSFRFIVPIPPDDPPRSSVPLAANAPAVTLQIHIDVDPGGYPVPTPTGQLSDATV